MADDLAYGIAAIRTRGKYARLQQEAARYAEQLRHTAIATMEAAARIVEARDPHTAGHQARVADLTVAIAVELGLPDEQVESIRMGATIHDVGKIGIPAEILNKPGRLTEHEFGLVQTHAETGHELIKDAQLPEAVTAMVHAHHERLEPPFVGAPDVRWGRRGGIVYICTSPRRTYPSLP